MSASVEKSRVNHLAAVDAEMVFELDENGVYEVKKDEDTYLIVDVYGECGICGNVNDYDYESPETRSFEAQYEDKTSGMCHHQQALYDAVDLGGECSECGSWSYHERVMTDSFGMEVASEFYCADCGKERWR